MTERLDSQSPADKPNDALEIAEAHGAAKQAGWWDVVRSRSFPNQEVPAPTLCAFRDGYAAAKLKYRVASSAGTRRSFSDFIRNATPEEKEAVYAEVMQKASERQSAVVASTMEPYVRADIQSVLDMLNECLPDEMTAEGLSFHLPMTRSQWRSVRCGLLTATQETPRSATEASSEVLSGCAVRAAIQQTDAKEIARLREIEHRAWHLLDDSEYRMDIGERVVSESLFGELCELLPEGHPEENETDATTDRNANG